MSQVRKHAGGCLLLAAGLLALLLAYLAIGWAYLNEHHRKW